MALKAAITNKAKSVIEKVIQNRKTIRNFWAYCSFIAFFIGYVGATMMVLNASEDTGQVMVGFPVLLFGGSLLLLTRTVNKPELPLTSPTDEPKVSDIVVDVGVPIITYFIRKYLKLGGWVPIICFSSFYVCAIGIKKVCQLRDEFAIIEILNTMVTAVIGCTGGVLADLFSIAFILLNRVGDGKMKKWVVVEATEEISPPNMARSRVLIKIKSLVRKVFKKREAWRWFWAYCGCFAFFIGYAQAALMVLAVSENMGQVMIGLPVVLFVGAVLWLSHIVYKPQPPKQRSEQRSMIADVIVDIGVPVLLFFIKKYLKIKGWEAIIGFCSFYIFAIAIKKVYNLEDEYSLIEILNTMVTAVIGANSGTGADLFKLAFIIANRVLESRLAKFLVAEEDDDHFE